VVLTSDLLVFDVDDFPGTKGLAVHHSATGTLVVFKKDGFQLVGKIVKLRAQTIEVNRFRRVLRVGHEWPATVVEIHRESDPMRKVVSNA
jgi:hypothetical protein